MFKPRIRIPRVGLTRPRQPLFRRQLHSVPALTYSGADGIPGLLSPQAFHLAYTEYMQFVTEKLNMLTQGTELEQKETRQIIAATAREPSQAPIFNYASMAHNNHFFFKNLNGNPDVDEVPIPEALKKGLEESFSSIETLRRELTITANAMFGPGFVWLVKNHKSSQYRILTTYLAGSPYPDAHWRRQGVDMNTTSGPTSTEQALTTAGFLGRTQLGAGGGQGSIWKKSVAPGGIETIPILCLNTWEHVWLMDYGVGAGGHGGKQVYVDNWWSRVNWEAVAEEAQLNSMLFRA